jgi:siroheme synthase
MPMRVLASYLTVTAFAILRAAAVDLVDRNVPAPENEALLEVVTTGDILCLAVHSLLRNR